ncbi:adenine-specific DNA methylase [Halanaerobium saccharolyticum]|uniref:Adenine-specific DNA methylase n=1 Tax=Halanaerobium saccharolyticum TaxID=43595 RepID=A0A4R6R5S8_9FIRM|nr:DNA methyltransferase [Halanaerobium saccharolyticum]TDP81094.1 adenine-specific DNA methylase [Halanaerobium saccharolyticum]
MVKENSLIEDFFPVNPINEIANKESKAKRYYRPVYTMHKWWARRLGSVFRSIIIYSLINKDEDISKYFVNDNSEEQLSLSFDTSKEELNSEELWKKLYLNDLNLNKTILDPFMGGGTTVVEGLRLGCNVIGCDLNPVAWFTVKKEIEPVDIDELENEFNQLEEEVAPEILKYYKTKCPECGDMADGMYYFWVKELDCQNCGKAVSLFKDYKLAKTRSKNKKGYWVVCPDCGEVYISQNYKGENNCPSCSYQFNPDKDGIASGQYFTCSHCGQKQNIIEATQEQAKNKDRMYAVEYYCETCDNDDNSDKTNGKSYKKVDVFDLELYKEVASEYNNKRKKLPIPQQKIPKGKETNRLFPHGYTYWKDLFNERQLLNLSTILKVIKNLKDDNIREQILLAFSDFLDLGNKFCSYNRSYNKMENMFGLHAFNPSSQFMENNIWGLKYGRGFKNRIDKVFKGKEYSEKPFEKYREENQTKEKSMNNQINGILAKNYNELSKNNKNTLLLNHTSEDLSEIPDKSIDAVITDPPYYDNVMYSELSDFFYVWLREVLKNEYDNFQNELTPKFSEIIKNNVQEKDDRYYINGLTRVFKESRKKLKDDGIMAFSFHHQNNKAWGAVLKSVLDAGLFVTAIYPIQAEMSTSMHIINQANVEYDMIIVCRKRLFAPEEKSWNKLKDKLSYQISDIINDLEDKDNDLSMGDIFIIALGKCLEVYSQYYPKVMEKGEYLLYTKITGNCKVVFPKVAN